MDRSVLIGHRAIHRVSLAVLLTDGLTGAAVTGSNARAWIENEKPPIKKNDGWFVFTDLPPKEYTILAEGGIYKREQLTCTVTGEGLRSVTLRLQPSRTYPVPPGCVRIEGSTEPGAVVSVYIPDKQSAFKLLADGKKGSEELTVFHGDKISLEGGSFRIITSGSEGENIQIMSATVEGGSTYRLSSQLQDDHPRVGTMLVPASVTTADKNGSFFMVLKGSPSSRKLVCESKGQTETVREFEISDSIIVKI